MLLETKPFRFWKPKRFERKFKGLPVTLSERGTSLYRSVDKSGSKFYFTTFS